MGKINLNNNKVILKQTNYDLTTKSLQTVNDWRRGVVVITTAQLHSFLRDGENL